MTADIDRVLRRRATDSTELYPITDEDGLRARLSTTDPELQKMVARRTNYAPGTVVPFEDAPTPGLFARMSAAWDRWLDDVFGKGPMDREKRP